MCCSIPFTLHDSHKLQILYRNPERVQSYWGHGYELISEKTETLAHQLFLAIDYTNAFYVSKVILEMMLTNT